MHHVVHQHNVDLLEEDLNTLGQIISLPSPLLTAGIIQLAPRLHTYWDASSPMCMPQSPILGASCPQNKNMCREDLNYTCLQFNQCGRKFSQYFLTINYSFVYSIVNT